MNSNSIALHEAHVEDILKNGIDKSNKKDIIVQKSNKGKQLLEKLYSGHNIDISNRMGDKKFITELIMNLLHFKQVVLCSEKLFIEWDNPLLSKLNNKLNDNFYLNAANSIKHDHELVNSEIFELTLADLLYAKSNYDENKVEHVMKLCMKLIGQEWLESGMIKSLKTNKELNM